MSTFPWYILIGRRVFKTDMAGYMKWSIKRNGAASESLAFTTVSPNIKVSTVFLCIDHRFFGEGKPVVFETMIFGGEHDGAQDRYTTYNKALDGHKKMVHLAREGLVKQNEN